jgi:hypothetical protein
MERASSHKFALRFAFEHDLKMARVSAIYTNNTFYTFTQDFIQIWQVHHMNVRIFLNVCFVFYCLLVSCLSCFMCLFVWLFLLFLTSSRCDMQL